jgi:thiol-disulfide isomerase/thioredoxin
MNIFKIFIIFSILCPTVVFSQSTEAKPRHWYQQQLIAKNFFLKKSSSSINDTSRTDSVFKVINYSWKNYVADSLQNTTTFPIAALNNLDAYSYYWAIKSINGYSYENNEVEFHVFKKYMLPSMIEDLKLVTANKTLIDKNLIWAGSLENAIALGIKFSNEPETYNSFYNFIKDFKTLLLPLISKDINNKAYSKLLNILDENQYEIEAKRYFSIQQPNLAFTYLITGISANKYYKPHAISFAKVLVDYFASKKETDKSLALLHNLFLNTSADELSRDTLKNWYERANGAGGVKLFDLIQKKLSGKTYEIASNKPVVFPQQWNLINIQLSEEKLKNAKFILVDFWYSACSPCIAEIPNLNRLYEQLKSREDVVFISINTDFQYQKSQAFVRETAKKFDVRFPIVYDDSKTNLSKQLNVVGYPAKFILTNKGQQITKGDHSPITIETFLDYMKATTNNR